MVLDNKYDRNSATSHHFVEVDGASPNSGSSVKALYEPTGTIPIPPTFQVSKQKRPDDPSHVDPPE